MKIYIDHIKTSHGRGDDSFQCNAYCKEKFETVQKLIDHDERCRKNYEERTVTKDGEQSARKFSCYCDKTFAFINTLKGNLNHYFNFHTCLSM